MWLPGRKSRGRVKEIFIVVAACVVLSHSFYSSHKAMFTSYAGWVSGMNGSWVVKVRENRSTDPPVST